MSFSFVGTDSRSTGVPTSIASFRIGRVGRRSAMPGASSRERVVKSRRNGRWRGSVRIPVSSVGGPSEIVSWSAATSSEIAPKVIAMFVNSCACCSATGATMLAFLPSALKNRAKRVSGSASASATGFRLRKSGSSSSMAMLSETPRPASPSPNPTRLVRPFSRVFESKVLLMSSNSVCATKFSGLSKTKPSGAPSALPRVISRYLRPNEER